MIPPEMTAVVRKSLQAAFGTEAIEDIRNVAKGLGSDLEFRIVIHGSAYLLRIMTRIDERMDPGRIFTCMRAAAEAGLAPRVRYLSPEEGISITDFVEARPLSPAQALLQIPDTIRRLHVLPPFPKTFNYTTAHNGFVWRLRGAGLLPARESEGVFARYQQLCAAYPRLDADMVSCHMDLKPDNIVFDGERIWLADWRAAFVNDRYFDLAVAANFIITSAADEWTYLEQYFGQAPDEYQRARFLLMQQVVHMMSAAVFLLLGSGGKPITPRESLPSFHDFHRRMWKGDVNLADNGEKFVYGMLHWKRLLQNTQQAEYDEALRIVAQRDRSPEGTRLLLPRAP